MQQKSTSLCSYKLARTKLNYLFGFAQMLRGSGGFHVCKWGFDCQIQCLIVDWFVQNVTRFQFKLKIQDKAPPAIVKVIIYSDRISFYWYNWITVHIIVHKCELLTRNFWVDLCVGFLVGWFVSLWQIFKAKRKWAASLNLNGADLWHYRNTTCL